MKWKYCRYPKKYMVRLTSLVFREECIVTACQDGYVCTWARPGRGLGQHLEPAASLASPTQPPNQVGNMDLSRLECSLVL